MCVAIKVIEKHTAKMDTIYCMILQRLLMQLLFFHDDRRR